MQPGSHKQMFEDPWLCVPLFRRGLPNEIFSFLFNGVLRAPSITRKLHLPLSGELLLYENEHKGIARINYDSSWKILQSPGYTVIGIY